MTGGRAMLLIIVLLLCSWACEKDDICVDGDTPLLIIRFYDIADTTELKRVPSLRVIGLGQSTVVNTFNDRTATDSIAIPLRISNTNTDFIFIRNSADEEGVETGNIDTLRFNYETREVFISRACGYVVNFDNLAGDLPSDASPWVQNLSIVNPNVQNQSSAHVKIFY
jgi:hypothetical protein